jgi:hypothetical protein
VQWSSHRVQHSHCVLLLQIMEEVDLKCWVASYKRPSVRPGSKSSALKSWRGALRDLLCRSVDRYCCVAECSVTSVSGLKVSDHVAASIVQDCLFMFTLRVIIPLLSNWGRLQYSVYAVSKLNVITKWKHFLQWGTCLLENRVASGPRYTSVSKYESDLYCSTYVLYWVCLWTGVQ